MRAQFIYEKFTEDSDPIHDMGIGIKHKIKEWIEAHRDYFRVYDGRCLAPELDKEKIIINDDGSLTVLGWVDVSDSDINVLPDYIRFRTIHGDFACTFDVDKYEKYMPKKVYGEIRYYRRKILDPRYSYTALPNRVIIEKIKSICKVKKSVEIRFG